MWPSGFIHIKDTVVRNTAVADRVRHAAGRHEAEDHQRQVERDQPRLPLPVAGQRQADLRRHRQVVQARPRPSSASACAPRSPRPSPARTPARRRARRPTRSPRASSPTPPARRSPGRRRSACSSAPAPGPGRPPGAYEYRWYRRRHPRSAAPPTRRSPRPRPSWASRSRSGSSRGCDGYTTKAVDLRRSARPVAPGQFHVTAAADDLRHAAGRPGPHRRARAPGRPAGRIHLQWLADGKPIDGATGTTYKLTPADLRKVDLAPGHRDPGRVRRRRRELGPDGAGRTRHVPQHPRAGRRRHRPGGRAADRRPRAPGPPRPSIAYQWVVGGTEVPGATVAHVHPATAGRRQAGHGRGPGLPPRLPDRARHQRATAPTLPGVFHSTAGAGGHGHRRWSATRSTRPPASWSLDAVTLSYQWYAGSQKIAGATSAAYQPTPAEAGPPLHVVVTADLAGLHEADRGVEPDRAASSSAAPPWTSRPCPGKALLGATLRAHVAAMAPPTATAHYRWLRGHDAIRGRARLDVHRAGRPTSASGSTCR